MDNSLGVSLLVSSNDTSMEEVNDNQSMPTSTSIETDSTHANNCIGAMCDEDESKYLATYRNDISNQHVFEYNRESHVDVKVSDEVHNGSIEQHTTIADNTTVINENNQDNCDSTRFACKEVVIDDNVLSSSMEIVDTHIVPQDVSDNPMDDQSSNTIHNSLEVDNNSTNEENNIKNNRDSTPVKRTWTNEVH
jgi:hypothetical protein